MKSNIQLPETFEKRRRRFRLSAKITLILIYLVIIAGAVVRMTGSGMGCPDWPKCFGYYIPPTEESQLEWHPETAYKKGQIIIVNETLRSAKENLITGDVYDEANWVAYTKHDYAIFNPAHTWVEYINRLFGALSGLATLLMAVFSLFLYRVSKKITIISILTVFGIGFQAWLGAKVVYSVLAPVKITIHMLMALILVAMVLYLLYLTKPKGGSFKNDALFNKLMLTALFLTVVQIALGTQVRQFIDEQTDELGTAAKKLWLHHPTLSFYVHRSFSILVFLLNGYLLFRNRNLNLGFSKISWVFLLVAAEALSGIIMYYFHFPFGSQTIHLVLASLLFGVQFYLILESRKVVPNP